MAKNKAPEAYKPDEKYQIEDDARTLMRAGEIHQDHKRHKNAMGHLKKQKRAITSMEQLKHVANNFTKMKQEEDAEGEEQ
jgi:hypothetical protein